MGGGAPANTAVTLVQPATVECSKPTGGLPFVAVGTLSGSDRLLIGLFGAVTVFAAAMLFFLPRLPDGIRIPGGLILGVVGLAALLLSAHAETSNPNDVPKQLSTKTLLAIEKAYLVPLLVASGLAFGLLIRDGDLWIAVKVPLLIVTGGIVAGLALLALKSDPLPERKHRS